MKKITFLTLILLVSNFSFAQLLSEGFEDITTLTDWGQVNASTQVGSTTWFQGDSTIFPSHEGTPNSHIGANFNSTTGTSTINTWLILPSLGLVNGDELTFYTRTVQSSNFPDRLEVRLSPTTGATNPASDMDVGTYTTLLVEINPNLTIGGYPEDWTMFTATVSGLSDNTPTEARLAFRYFVTDAGPTGDNSNFIGIDTVTVTSAALSNTEFSLNDIKYHFDISASRLVINSQVALKDVVLYNVLGQEAYRSVISSNASEHNLSTLQSGVYIAKINSQENKSKTIKLVIK